MEKTKKTKLILSLSAGLPALILLYHFLQPQGLNHHPTEVNSIIFAPLLKKAVTKPQRK